MFRNLNRNIANCGVTFDSNVVNELMAHLGLTKLMDQDVETPYTVKQICNFWQERSTSQTNSSCAIQLIKALMLTPGCGFLVSGLYPTCM